MPSTFNRRVKKWPGWVALLFVLVAFLAVGVARTSGPQTPSDRVDSVTQRVACPICDGESVFESQNNASRAIRKEVTEMVGLNELDDDQIVAFIENRYGADVLLVPRTSGIDVLVWVLPVVGFVVGLAALAVVFRRWRRAADQGGTATDADRVLVESALSAQDASEQVPAPGVPGTGFRPDPYPASGEVESERSN